MSLLIKNIKGLLQVRDGLPAPLRGAEMQQLPVLDDAFLYIKDGKIDDFGPKEEAHAYEKEAEEVIDAEGKFVLPCFIDSHTHIVYAESREHEFVMRLRGMTYEEIATAGGGILNSAKKLQQTSEEALFQSARARLHEMILQGTGAVEVKSGYGLTVEDELKMLRVIRRLKEESPVTIKATFLGAHAVPKEYTDREEYIRLILDEMIPRVTQEKLADYCDVFCDKGFFTPEETDRIFTQAAQYGMKLKIHANELDFSGGVQVGVKHNAVSADHLECTGDEEISALLSSDTMPVLLPGTAFFLNIPYPPARRMIDAGLPAALATDYNPGTCPSGNMPLVLSIACTQLKMTPEEAFNAATVNAAFALNLQDTHGCIARGREANIFITHKMSSYAYMPYAFGSNPVEQVILKGKKYQDFRK